MLAPPSNSWHKWQLSQKIHENRNCKGGSPVINFKKQFDILSKGMDDYVNFNLYVGKFEYHLHVNACPYVHKDSFNKVTNERIF